MNFVDSFNIEFGYELLSSIPYAYELHLQGKLSGTRSGFDTESLYYFSPNHSINPEARSWFNTEKALRNGLPNTYIHKSEQPDKIFPPYKEIFRNKEYKFNKPTLCICNRYNVEWSFKAINFFDTEILDWMFSNLKDKYEIIYFPVDLPKELQDSIQPMKLKDKEIARKHEIKIFSELSEGKSWNETLLKVFSNCDHFITMNGGYSILASMFSGTNIIYSVPGEVETREIKSKSFWRWYPNINNVRTLHVPDYDSLKKKIQALYIDQLPCLNIIVRTTRPNYLKRCIKSIYDQDYDNINLVLVCDNPDSVIYTRTYDARMIKVQRKAQGNDCPGSSEYGKYFPYNSYLDSAQRLINGFIMFLDDDDKMIRNDSATKIMREAKKNSLIVWKVDMKDYGIIPNESFNKKITLYDITGIGFCYHSNHINKTDWSEWKRADFRTAKKLSESLKIKWIDEVLTGIQDRPGGGTKEDLQEAWNSIRVMIEYPGGRKHEQSFEPEEYKEIKNILKNQGIICTDLQN